jgi:ferrochelatase
VGFVSDHLEVLYDLDVEAVQAGERLGLPLARAATPGTHPQFVSMITELVRERAGEEPARATLGGMAPGPDVCPDGCCRPRAAVPGPGRPGGSG